MSHPHRVGFWTEARLQSQSWWDANVRGGDPLGLPLREVAASFHAERRTDADWTVRARVNRVVEDIKAPHLERNDGTYHPSDAPTTLGRVGGHPVRLRRFRTKGIYGSAHPRDVLVWGRVVFGDDTGHAAEGLRRWRHGTRLARQSDYRRFAAHQAEFTALR